MAVTTPGGLVRSSVQWDARQLAYLKAVSERHGLRSVSAAVRMLVNAAIDAERKTEAA